MPLPLLVARALGLAALAITSAYLVLAALGRELRIGGAAVRLPSLPLAAAQVAVSAADWLLAAVVLYVLLPAASPLSLAGLVGLFVVAQVAALASQLPGGVGVFEAIVLAALTPAVPAPEVLSSLVAYRLVYYLAPFVSRSRSSRERGRRPARAAGARAEGRARLVRAGRSLARGGGEHDRGRGAARLGRDARAAARLDCSSALPLALLEMSHFVGSLVGAALLLLARALQRRLDAA